MPEVIKNLGVNLACTLFEKLELGRHIWSIEDLHYAFVKCPKGEPYQERVIMLRLNLGCEEHQNCRLTEADEWDSAKLCYCFIHCRKPDSYETCRFHKGEKDGTGTNPQ